MSRCRHLIRYWPVRFLVDFYYSPLAAIRRYSKRRTWPTPKQFAAMSQEEFVAYLESIGMRR